MQGTSLPAAAIPFTPRNFIENYEMSKKKLLYLGSNIDVIGRNESVL